MRVRTLPALLAALALAPACKDDGVGTEPTGTVGVENVEPTDVGQYLSMEVAPDGRLAVSYYDRTKGGVAFAWGELADDGSVTWTEERVDGYADDSGLDPGDRGKYTSLGFSPDGTAWVAYFDASLGTLKVARRAPEGGWTTEVADVGGGLSTTDAGRFASLAIGTDGFPAVAHYDKEKGGLRFARYNGTTWEKETVDAGTEGVAEDGTVLPPDTGLYARLLLDGTTWTIAYYDATHGDLRLAAGTPGNWSLHTVDSVGDVGAWPSMIVRSGQIFIAYQDVGEQDLELAYGSGDTWSRTTIDPGEYRGADTEIYDEGGSLGVVYFDGYGNDVLLAREGSGGWTVDKIAGDDAGLGFHNETVLVDGQRLVACYDYTNRKVFVQAL